MASLIKRGKFWNVKYQDHTGKQVWVKGYSDRGETERLARKLEDEARAIKLGDVDPLVAVRRVERSKPIVTQLAEYKAKLQAAGRDPNHVAYTIADVEKLVAFGAIQSAAEITVTLIDRWKLALMTAKVDANKTINRRVSSVQQFLFNLFTAGGVSEYVLKKYPMLPVGGIHQKRFTRALDRDEVAKLIAHADGPERMDLYRFASKSGLRRNECMKMLAANMDFEHKIINIPAHVAKAKRDQTVSMHDDLVAMLKDRCSRLGDAPLFTVKSKQAEIQAIRKACTAAKVDPKNLGFHSLRHTFCTLLARANVHPALLQKLARHRDLKTTLRYYVHLQRSDEATAINLV